MACLAFASSALARDQLHPGAAIGVATASGISEPVKDGLFRVPIWITLQNVGTERLDKVQVAARVAEQIAPARLVEVTGLSVSGDLRQVRRRFDGKHRLQLLSGRESLAVGESATISYQLLIDPNMSYGPFLVQVTARAVAKDKEQSVRDCSVNGKDPDPRTPELEPQFNAWARDICNDTPIFPPEHAKPPNKGRIGLAKAASETVVRGSGRFETTLSFVVENFSAATITDVQVSDDLAATFPSPATYRVQEISSPGFEVNNRFNGNQRPELLAEGNTLEPYGKKTVSVQIDFEPNGVASPFRNTALVSGSGAPPDRSTDGSDPDPDDNGYPDEEHPTLIPYPLVPLPTGVIGIAKRVAGEIVPQGYGFRVPFELVVRNYTDQPLTNVQVWDDFRQEIGPVAMAELLEPPRVSGDLSGDNGNFDLPAQVNGDFGLTDTKLLTGTQTLPAHGDATITFAVLVTPQGAEQPLFNQARVEALDAHNNTVSDFSDDGANPDPNGNGDPTEAGENDPTPFSLPIKPVVGLAKSASSSRALGPDSFETTLSFVLRNYSNVVLEDVQLVDKLTDTFPAPATFEVLDVRSEQLAVNPEFDGRGNAELLSGGDTLAENAEKRLTLKVRFAPNGLASPFLNSATVSSSTGASDQSTDGTDPDPNGDGYPKESVPTPIPFVLAPPPSPPPGVIGVAKRVAGDVVPVGEFGPEGVLFRVPFAFVIKNYSDQPLKEVQLLDDLAGELGPTAKVVKVANPKIYGDLEFLSEDLNGNAPVPSKLLSGTETLEAWGHATLSLDVFVKVNHAPLPLFNQARIEGIDQSGKLVYDLSDNGADPDPNGNGDPTEIGENDPTPVTFPSALAGTVYRDNNHDRQFDQNPDASRPDMPLDNWRIEVLRLTADGEAESAAETTTSDGTYSIIGLPPGDYVVQFRRPVSDVVWGRATRTLKAGKLAIADLPVDPQGVFYDLLSRELVPGVQVSVTDSNDVLLPEQCLLDGQQSQITERDAAYQFDLLLGEDAACPEEQREYRLRIDNVPEPYLADFSELRPPEFRPLSIDCPIDADLVAPCLVQGQNGAPRGDESTTHYRAFFAGPAGQNLVNNHIPLETENPPLDLKIFKQALRPTVSVGGLAAYRVKLVNDSAIALPTVNVTDKPAAGFRLVADSARLVRAGADDTLGTDDDVVGELAVTGSSLATFEPLALAAGEVVELRYVTRVSAGVFPGRYPNVATAQTGALRVSADATVEVVGDPIFDQTTVIGKVFNDQNKNGRLDPGEPGVAGARLITADGLMVETDRSGRFHIAGIDVHSLRGATYAVKLDVRSLPENSRANGRIRQLVQITPGMMAKANFPVRLDCCARLTTDPSRVEKKLDARLQSVKFTGSSANARIRVRSNYFDVAPNYRLAVYRAKDTAFLAPVADSCFRLDESNLGADDVAVELKKVTLGQKFTFVVYAYPGSDCSPLSAEGSAFAGTSRTDASPHDATHAQTLEVRNFKPPPAARAYRNLLRVDRIPVSGVRQLWVDRSKAKAEATDYIASSELLFSRRKAPRLLAQPVEPAAITRAIDNNASADVFFRPTRQSGSRSTGDASPGDRPAGQKKTLVTKLSPPADEVVVSANKLRTEMLCCGLQTSVEAITDDANNVIAVRIDNSSESPIRFSALVYTPDSDPLETRDSDPPESPTRLPMQRIGSQGTHELFLGSFDSGGPVSGSKWSRLVVRIERDEEHPLSEDGVSKYSIQRLGRDVNGQWLPPRTRAQCRNVEAVPTVAFDGSVPSIRVNHMEPSAQDVPDVELAPPSNFGVVQIDLTLGGYSASGELSELFEEFDESSFVDGRIAAYWRGVTKNSVSWVARVDTTYDQLGRMGKNLRRKDGRRLFRQLDADQYYPDYGDDSTTRSDVDSRGAFYARVNWKNSQALWGSYNTGLVDSEFAQYNRSLYGALLDYKSADSTSFSASQRSLKLFASEAQSLNGRALFRATGGSLYYLRHTDIVVGSEKVWVEVRRRDSERLLDREILQIGRDYEIDPIQGRVLLSRPLSQVVRERANPLISSAPIEGDDVFLIVDYEYDSTQFSLDGLTYGAHGKWWLGDHLAIGGSHVEEERDGGNYQLDGIDLTWRHSAGSYLSFEYARSNQRQRQSALLSNDGGLSFESVQTSEPWGGWEEPVVESASGSARAFGFDARLDLHDFVSNTEATPGYVELWWKRRDEGFSSGRFISAEKTTDLGGDFEVGLDDWRVYGGFGELKKGQRRRDRHARVGVEYSCGPDERLRCLELALEARYEDSRWLEPNGVPAALASSVFPQDGEAVLLGGRVALPVTEDTSVFVQGQGSTAERRGYEENNRVGLGITRQMAGDRDRAYTIEASHGDRGNALSAGVDITTENGTQFNVSSGIGSGASSQFATRFALTEGQELYGTYTINPDRTDGARNLLTLGQRRQLGNRLQVFSESQFGRNNGTASTAHLLGIELDRFERWNIGSTLQSSRLRGDKGSFERTAISLGATFTSELTRFSSRLEYRDDDGEGVDNRQYLTSNALSHRIGEHSRLLAKLNLSLTDNDLSVFDAGRFAELSLAYAYRPVASDWLNALAKYSFLYDVGTEGQSTTVGDERAHLLAVEALLDVGEKFSVGGKLAYKRGALRVQKGTGQWIDFGKRLVVLRGGYKVAHLPWFEDSEFKRHWTDEVELFAEYRWLTELEENSTRSGALLALYKRFNANYRGGIGYNFSGFDDELRDGGYQAHGWFVDLTAVF